MRRFIRFLFQKFGYDIIKYKPIYAAGKLDRKSIEKEYKWIKDHQFSTIIDIGANEGQFSDKMRMLFPSASIHAFEPLRAVYKQLKINFSNDSQFKAYNLALGDAKGELIFQESEYSPSSSFLPATESLQINFEAAAQTKTVTVQVDTLDAVFGKKAPSHPLLVKIDVQGFEDRVIRGGQEILEQADMIICELSFVELYDRQMLFDGIYSQFKALGFKYAGNIEQMYSPETNQVLQADGVFIKQDRV